MTALTTAERQSRRQAALDSKAQAIGYPTWRKLETELLKGKLEITKMAKFINISERYGEAEITSLADYQELNPDGDFIEQPDRIIEMKNTNGNAGFEIVAVPMPDNWMEALRYLEAYSRNDEVIQVLVDAVEPLCKTDTDWDTTLEHWLKHGSYDSDTDTPESIAAEWDALSEE